MKLELLVEAVACDLCGAVEADLLYTLSDTAHGGPGAFGWWRCVQCGSMYLNPRPTRETIAVYYPSEYTPYRPSIESERWSLMRWMRRRKLIQRRKLIEQFSGLRQGDILDVGCATGLFLHEMALAGWRAKGVELVGEAAKYAQREFDLEVFQGTLAEAPYAPASFDVITFWDVLEHTFSPKSELAMTARLLRPGGLIVINVPNWDSVDRRLFGPHWQGFDTPRHLHVFTRATLTALLAGAGFSVVDWVCFMPGFFTFLPSLQRSLATRNPVLAQTVMRVLNVPGARLLFEPLFSLLNYLGRGPVISVFARRLAN